MTPDNETRVITAPGVGAITGNGIIGSQPIVTSLTLSSPLARFVIDLNNKVFLTSPFISSG